MDDVVTYDFGAYIVFYMCKIAHTSTGTEPFDTIFNWILIGYFTNPVENALAAGTTPENWEARDNFGVSQKAIHDYIAANSPAAQVQTDWNEISGLGVLLNKPAIPAAQIQSNWNQSVTSALDFIKNKPVIPTIPATQPKVYIVKVISDTTILTVGTGKVKFPIPFELNGMVLTKAHIAVTTASSSGIVTIQIYNYTDSADMLSTPITIDDNEFTSYSAFIPPVIDTNHDGVSTGDIIGVDVDVAGTGAKGLTVILTFTNPIIEEEQTQE